MSIRRRTDASMTQRIWDAIKITINQRSLPSNDRIVRHISRVYGTNYHVVQEELNKAVADGLVFLKKVQSKGGIEQESYRLPVEPSENEGCDWYCYHCHKAGLVEACKQCFRAYHPECHTPNNPEHKICDFCEKINSDCCSDIIALNHILGFTCGHLKAKLPQEITNRKIVSDSSTVEISPGGLVGPTWVSEGEDVWRPVLLIKNHMDLTIMEGKTKKNQLVYAKQKGYPYWPAKVMEIKHDLYDVRFFGGHHMRANIEKYFIKPITASIHSLQVRGEASESNRWKYRMHITEER